MGIFGQSQQGQARYSGKLHNLQLTQSVFGTTATVIHGTDRVAAKLLFYGGFYAKNAPGGGKGLGGGKGSQQYDYYADVQLALASGSAAGGCLGILNIWDQQGKMQNQSGLYAYTIPSGGGTVIPQTQPPIKQNLGVSKLVPYSVVVNDYGSGGSRTLTGIQRIAMTLTTGAPGIGQYAFNATTGAYTFSAADVGVNVDICYSTVYSLYYFQTTQAAEVPLLSPWQISTTNQPYYYSDQGVTRVDTGAALTRGGTTQGYTVSAGVYTFTSDLAGVYVYINYTYTSNDSTITNTSTLNLTFFGGALGQAPNSYWTSKYPGAAFGYPGICHVDANPMALGSSAVLPSYNYEVIGLNIFPGGGLDAHFCDVFRTHLYDAFLGVGFPYANVDNWTSCYAYWAANGYLGKIKLDTQTSVASAMKEVIDVGNVGAVWSGGLLKLIPYGDTSCVGYGYTYTPNTTPVVQLTNNDLLPSSEKKAGQSGSEDPVQWEIKAPQDCWNYVQAQFCNRANDYNNELINQQNDAFINLYGRRMESPQTWDWITSASAALWALNLRLKRQCYITNTCKLWLSYRFAYLEPMDMVTLPTGENIRITQITDDANGRLAIEAEQWTYGSSSASIYTVQPPSGYNPPVSQALPGNTFPVIFETATPGPTDQSDIIQIAAAGQLAAWGGCDVFVSNDGTTYDPVGTIVENACNGILSAALAVGADPDTTHTLSVDLTISGGPLSSVTLAQCNAFASLAAIVDQTGTVELIAYETATLTGPNRYNLTHLRRGVYGTPILAHAIGAEFCFIGVAGLFKYPYPPQYVTTTVYFKFASFNLAGNQMQDLSVCQAYPYIVKGTLYPAPLSVILTQSSTAPGGSANSLVRSGITPNGNGLNVSNTVWLTVTWTWPANFPVPLGFNVVVYDGTDPTIVADYLFALAVVGPGSTSYTAPVIPSSTMTLVNAAVQAVYIRDSAWTETTSPITLTPLIDVAGLEISTSQITPSANTTIPAPSTAVWTPVAGLAFNVTSYSAGDGFQIIAAICLASYGSTYSTSFPWVIAVVVDGNTTTPVLPQVVAPTIAPSILSTTTFPYFASVTGLLPGAHTIAIYVQSNASTTAIVEQAGTTAVCQHIF